MASSSSFDIPTTPHLDIAVIRTAFQLYSFLEATGKSYLQYISHEVGLTLEYIVIKYPRPEQVVPATATARTFKRSTSAESPEFPPIWATDTVTFRRAATAFADRIYEFRRLP